MRLHAASARDRLVLLHGFTGSASTWGRRARRSARAIVIAIDLPGHGGSPARSHRPACPTSPTRWSPS
jgi:pimeloyl-ACP methyl ester carboxylesterase